MFTCRAPGANVKPMKTPAEILVEEIEKHMPEFLLDPVDLAMSKGNAAFTVIDPKGRTFGRIVGTDADKGRWCFGIASRKVIQVWRTGYDTGEFEALVYAGKLDEGPTGVNRPDFIGWQGGVALEDASGAPYAAAFSGFRGIKDVAIILRSCAAAGLRPRTHAA